jgi:hypothetical protein
MEKDKPSYATFWIARMVFLIGSSLQLESWMFGHGPCSKSQETKKANKYIRASNMLKFTQTCLTSARDGNHRNELFCLAKLVSGINYPSFRKLSALCSLWTTKSIQPSKPQEVHWFLWLSARLNMEIWTNAKKKRADSTIGTGIHVFMPHLASTSCCCFFFFFVCQNPRSGYCTCPVYQKGFCFSFSLRTSGLHLCASRLCATVTLRECYCHKKACERLMRGRSSNPVGAYHEPITVNPTITICPQVSSGDHTHQSFQARNRFRSQPRCTNLAHHDFGPSIFESQAT